VFEKISEMGKFLSTFILFICLISRLNILASTSNLRTGDVILLDMDCWSCSLIEDETAGPYSHSGVILEINGKIYVGQALSEVYLLDLKTFLAYTKKKALHLRPKNINEYDRLRLVSDYKNKFAGIIFDHAYEWGDDKLYCSEFIYKLLDGVLDFKNFGPRPMNYTRNWDAWTQYFGHTPPQGKLGISPNDFGRSNEFRNLGFLKGVVLNL
jgi:hypothetical protein